MAIDLTQPLDVAYLVVFRSGGDTTKDAFGKHIQEIERIYGIINALNSDKLSVSEFNTRLNSHINDSNPHPNLDLANTKGNLATSRLDGTIPMSKITGDLDSSRITGNFATSRITGLESYVQSKSTGITEGSVSANGYAKFGNGLIIQWGHLTTSSTEYENTVYFSKAFPTTCFIIVANVTHSQTEILHDLAYCVINEYTTRYFKINAVAQNSNFEMNAVNFPITWLALGS